MSGYKLSVIVTSFNQSRHLKQCLDSVLKTKIRGLEVVVVDDGSEDGSQELIQRYADTHSNLVYTKQVNRGRGYSRNRGMQLAKGEYLAFLDASDYMDTKGLVKLYDSARRRNSDTAIGNVTYFDREHQWTLPNWNRVINQRENVQHIDRNPELNLVPNIGSMLFRREFVVGGNVQFDENLSIGEDLLFMQYCLHSSNTTVLYPHPVLYNRSHKSVSTTSLQGTFLYFEQLILLQQRIVAQYETRVPKKELLPIEQRQLEFMLDSLAGTGESLLQEDEARLLQLAEKFLQTLTSELALMKLSVRQRLLIEIIKRKDALHLDRYMKLSGNAATAGKWMERDGTYYDEWADHFEPYAELLEVNHLEVTHRIEVAELSGSVLSIGGYAFLNHISMNNCRKWIVFRNDNIVHSLELENQLRTDVTYLYAEHGVNYDEAGFQTAEIDLGQLLEPGHWEVFVRLSVGNTVIEKPLEIPLARLRNQLKSSICRRMLYTARCREHRYLSITIKPASPVNIIARGLRQRRKDIRYYLGLLRTGDYQAFICVLLFLCLGRFWRGGNVWLIGERRDTAQDNSYHLFKYIREREPHLAVRYVIDRDSPDYKHIRRYGNVIPFGSLRHTMHLLTCGITINSYIESANMYTDAYKKIIKHHPEWPRNHKAFLQHGVIGVSRVNHSLHKNRTNYSLFIVSSPFEQRHIVEEFGYSEQEVAVTGLARWDALEDTSIGNEILLMPTWRNWIKTADQLKNSNYYQTYHSLLSNPKFHELLEQNNWQVTFYPHYKIQQLIGELPNYHERINVVRQGEETVQQLLKRHRLLITDYSTVSFDFAYMEKPVLFYQFDYQEFYSSHYNEGPINHKKDLFGDVLETEEQLIEALALDGLNADPSKLVRAGRYMSRNQKHSRAIVDRLLSLSAEG